MSVPHRLSGIDTENRVATCSVCGVVEILKKGEGRWRCAEQARARQRAYRQENGIPPEDMERFYEMIRRCDKPYRKNPWRRLVVLDRCKRCGYTPEDPDEPIELDVHHRDGDKRNNDPENLKVLCSNCHRIVTHKERKARGAAFTAPRPT